MSGRQAKRLRKALRATHGDKLTAGRYRAAKRIWWRTKNLAAALLAPIPSAFPKWGFRELRRVINEQLRAANKRRAKAAAEHRKRRAVFTRVRA